MLCPVRVTTAADLSLSSFLFLLLLTYFFFVFNFAGDARLLFALNIVSLKKRVIRIFFSLGKFFSNKMQLKCIISKRAGWQFSFSNISKNLAQNFKPFVYLYSVSHITRHYTFTFPLLFLLILDSPLSLTRTFAFPLHSRTFFTLHLPPIHCVLFSTASRGHERERERHRHHRMRAQRKI